MAYFLVYIREPTERYGCVIELDSGSETRIEHDAGLLVILHLVFGRIEAVNGEHTIQLLPGDNLYAEVFNEVRIIAREPSLCVMITCPDETSNRRG